MQGLARLRYIHLAFVQSKYNKSIQQHELQVTDDTQAYLVI